MKFEYIGVQRDGGRLEVTINRPSKLNALSRGVMEELVSLLEPLVEERDGVHGMLFTGAGEKAFIAGADISEMRPMGPEEGAHFGRLGQRVPSLLEDVPFPVIACVNGYALGGGCEMALGCDFVYATANARFGQPEVKLGLIPGFGGCVRLIEAVGPGLAKEMIYTGRQVSAAEAKQMGLVSRIFETKAELLEGARETLDAIAANSADAVALCKRSIVALPGKSRDERMSVENDAFRHAFTTDDMREGTEAFLAKRKPSFPSAE